MNGRETENLSEDLEERAIFWRAYRVPGRVLRRIAGTALTGRSSDRHFFAASIPLVGLDQRSLLRRKDRSSF
jgi:hypothetical protein